MWRTSARPASVGSTPRAPLEELHAEAAFQVRESLAGRGQGQVFLGGTAGDRAGLLDGQHEVEGGEVVAHVCLSLQHSLREEHDSAPRNDSTFAEDEFQ
jgi:hypothetical protein